MEWITSPPRLPARSPDAHKGTFGRALLVGGSRGMAGAIGLAGMACLRAGAGLTTVATPDVCLDTVASYEPCYTTVPLPSDSKGRITGSAGHRLEELWERFTCLAVGPGLGQSDHLALLMEDAYRDCPLPMVVDADGLNALSKAKWAAIVPGGKRILTPHPGEFKRLVAEANPTDDRNEQESLAARKAKQSQTVILLKGRGTYITDGVRQYRNTTGNPGMAKGGSGDVLTGIILAFLAQGLDAFDAACLGAYVHGLAGDLAAAEMGQVSLIARDLLRFLPGALRQVADA
jgi:ADP-dependent NAD(P)H-hydrate dehydratase